MQITHITLQIADQTIALTLAEIQELLQLLLDIPGITVSAPEAPDYTVPVSSGQLFSS